MAVSDRAALLAEAAALWSQALDGLVEARKAHNGVVSRVSAQLEEVQDAARRRKEARAVGRHAAAGGAIAATARPPQKIPGRPANAGRQLRAAACSTPGGVKARSPSPVARAAQSAAAQEVPHPPRPAAEATPVQSCAPVVPPTAPRPEVCRPVPRARSHGSSANTTDVRSAGSDVPQQIVVEFADPSTVRVCLDRELASASTQPAPSPSDAVDGVSQCSESAIGCAMPRPSQVLLPAPSGSEVSRAESQVQLRTSALEVLPQTYQDSGLDGGSLASQETHGSTLHAAGWTAQGAFRRAAEEAGAASEVSCGGPISDAS